MKATLLIVVAIIIARLAFLLYELIYFSSADVKISVISELLILPLMLVLYMVYDGNKGLAAVLVISAVVRIIYHFASVYPSLPADTAGATVYTVIFIAVMAMQFILSLFLMNSKLCGRFFAVRLKVNMQIRSEMMKK